MTIEETLTDSRDERFEFGVGREGNDQTLDRRDGGRERQDGAVHVVGAGPVRVFEERVQDATDTERRLDHVRDKLADFWGYRRKTGQRAARD